MSARNLKMLKCINGHYSLDEKCPECSKKTFNAEPVKFSSADKYGKERRKALYGI